MALNTLSDNPWHPLMSVEPRHAGPGKPISSVPSCPGLAGSFPSKPTFTGAPNAASGTRWRLCGPTRTKPHIASRGGQVAPLAANRLRSRKRARHVPVGSVVCHVLRVLGAISAGPSSLPVSRREPTAAPLPKLIVRQCGKITLLRDNRPGTATAGLDAADEVPAARGRAGALTGPARPFDEQISWPTATPRGLGFRCWLQRRAVDRW
jgi:hypothetical protein